LDGLLSIFFYFSLDGIFGNFKFVSPQHHFKLYSSEV